MSRITGDAVFVKPTNNIYTALLAISVVLEIVAFLCVFMQYNGLFKQTLFAQ